MRLRLRSMAVSLATASVEVGLFALCTVVLAGSTALATARWVCGALGAVCNFLLNRSWAFRERFAAGGLRGQAVRYGLTALAAVTLATGVWLLIRLLTGWDPRLVHVCSMVAVWMLFTFPLMRRWVFGGQPERI